MTEEKRGLRWGIERRLEFLEFRLYWQGRVNRADLVGQFGISSQQASTDFSRYQEMAPDNIRYDGSEKTYVAADGFAPILYTPDSESYLSQLRLVSEGVMKPEDLWMAPVPAFDAVPIPRRRVDPARLRSVVKAVNAGHKVEILYQSMSRPEPGWRWVTPHALGFDGFRWHVRALCHIDMAFKDFLLPRILDVGASEPYPLDPGLDREWNMWTTLEIGPHPALTPGQRTAVETDYGMEGGRLEVATRLAFVYYVKKRLGLDVDPALRKPQDQQVVLLNGAEVDAAFAAAHRGEEA